MAEQTPDELAEIAAAIAEANQSRRQTKIEQIKQQAPKSIIITEIERFIPALDRLIEVVTDKKMLVVLNSTKSYMEKKITEEWESLALADKL